MNYEQRIVEILDRRKCPLANARTWGEKFVEGWDLATRGAGDSHMLDAVNRQFVETLSRHSCVGTSP